VKLPPGIGPHEGQEFDLMKRGVKHVAMFINYTPDYIDEFLSDDSFSSLSVLHDRSKFSYFRLIVYHKSHEAQAQELADIVATYGEAPHIDSAMERRIGQILSYSEEEISAWLKHIGADD
jgi:hypothetical protein